MNFSVSEFITETESNDFKILGISIDVEIFEFTASIEGIYWFKDNAEKPVLIENGGYISVKNYLTFESRFFSPKGKLWYTLDYKNLEVIDEINEKSYENGVLRLAGMGKKSGNWIEYLIEGGEINIFFNE